MKWSLTKGLEFNSLTGFNLRVGSKREAGKRRPLTHQSMHNWQCKFAVLHHFVCLTCHTEAGQSVSAVCEVKPKKKVTMPDSDSTVLKKRSESEW